MGDENKKKLSRRQFGKQFGTKTVLIGTGAAAVYLARKKHIERHKILQDKLYWAIRDGDIPKIKESIEQGADINKGSGSETERWRGKPVHLAAEWVRADANRGIGIEDSNRGIEILQALLDSDQKLKINAKDQSGQTALNILINPISSEIHGSDSNAEYRIPKYKLILEGVDFFIQKGAVATKQDKKKLREIRQFIVLGEKKAEPINDEPSSQIQTSKVTSAAQQETTPDR